jgi:hypothetical protein
MYGKTYLVTWRDLDRIIFCPLRAAHVTDSKCQDMFISAGSPKESFDDRERAFYDQGVTLTLSPAYDQWISYRMTTVASSVLLANLQRTSLIGLGV